MSAEIESTQSGTVYSEEERERFIPVGKQEVVADLLEGEGLSPGDVDLFRHFAKILAALYHYYFHEDLETLKQAYQPFSPDSDTISVREHSDAELYSKRKEFLASMEKLLDDANYETLGESDINDALAEQSPYGLTLYVDLDDFDEMLLYFRGSAIRVDQVRTWKKLWLGKTERRIPIYKRLALVLKLKAHGDMVAEIKERLGIEEEKAFRLVRKKRRGVTNAMSENSIYLKLFRDIPRSDLEMLFPNTQLRMNLLDKVKIGITGGGATLFGIFKTVTTLLGAALTLAVIPVLFGLAGLIARQVMKVFNLRTKYMVQLSQNLYFHNLDNNAGVFTHLIDLAEEEECKEAILAYYFLLTEADRRYDEKALDARIEAYISERYGIPMDFEVDDGLRKLERAGLLVREDDGALGVLPLQASCTRLDEEWDNFFQFNEPEAAAPLSAATHEVPARPPASSFGSTETSVTRREELPPEVLARLRGEAPPADPDADEYDQLHGVEEDADRPAAATDVVLGPAPGPKTVGAGADDATMAFPSFNRDDVQAEIEKERERLAGNDSKDESDDEGEIPPPPPPPPPPVDETRDDEPPPPPPPPPVDERVAICGDCGARYNAEKFKPGTRFRCKKCKTVVVVP